MKSKATIAILFFAISALTACIGIRDNTNDRLSDYVKPNIGTVHCRWFHYTPAAVPFGMAKLAPSTNGSYGNIEGWEAVGYDDRHGSIEGFSCFHEFQIGGIMLMPICGELQTSPGKLDSVNSGYRSSFRKVNEHAEAGYYRVLLDKYRVTAELTASKRVGYQRYTFPKSAQSQIIFDIGNRLGESGAVLDASIDMVNDSTVQGYVTTLPEYVKRYQPGARVSMYFYARLSKPAKTVSIFKRGERAYRGTSIRGSGACMALKYHTSAQEQITVKLGQSYTSIENAKLNYESEAAGVSFEEAQKNALMIWNEHLNRIHVSGGADSNKIKFYTGMYHALLGRGLVNDVNGAYPANNGTIKYIDKDATGRPRHQYYNSDAIWGAFWNLTQLWAIAFPEYYSDWVQSQLLVYKETGWLGDGIANSKYVSGVGTNFTGLAIAAAYNCGIRDYNVNEAYQAALKNELQWQKRPAGAGKADMKPFLERGYCPYIPSNDHFVTRQQEGSVFGASHTLEYAFSSYAVAQFAKQLKKQSDYLRLSALANNWEKLFDPTTKLIRPRMADGNFIKEFKPLAPWEGFQEGNAMQYTFYVPHEPEKLVHKIGKSLFNTRLDSIFLLSQKDVFGGGRTVDAFAGVHARYNHGNQPNLHVSWLFNFSGRPDLSQKWVRSICNEFYGTEALHGYGYGQDEDQGQLGAWYVMSAMGIFDVRGLTGPNPQFQIGSPLFKKITITLNDKYYTGKEFVIETENNSDKNNYLQSVQKDGNKLRSPAIAFADIVRGGSMKLTMGATPQQHLK